jgi:hypothetical protein
MAHVKAVKYRLNSISKCRRYGFLDEWLITQQKEKNGSINPTSWKTKYPGGSDP